MVVEEGFPANPKKSSIGRFVMDIISKVNVNRLKIAPPLIALQPKLVALELIYPKVVTFLHVILNHHIKPSVAVERVRAVGEGAGGRARERLRLSATRALRQM